MEISNCRKAAGAHSGKACGTSADEIPPACHDAKARIAAMDEDHVLASLLFPNLPGFAGGL